MKAWFLNFTVQKLELKLASVLALVTAIIALIVMLWSSFLSQEDNSTVASVSPSKEVNTIARPQSSPPIVIPKAAKPDNAVDRPASKDKATQPKVNPKKTNTPNVIKVVLGQGNYFVQVGAFTQAKLARLMLEKMKKKYHYATIKRKGDKHAVWVGPVIKKSEAVTLKKVLQRKSNIQGYIVKEK